MSIQKGQKAPSFELYSSENKKVTSDNLAAKPYVLLFFPMAFTSVCTAELCHMRDQMSKYNDMGARIIGISVDSPFTLARFKEDQGLNFTLLSDFNKEVSRAYGALHEEFVMNMKGVSKRSAFVVDSNGVVQYTEVLDDPSKEPSYEAIDQTLSQL